MSLNECDKCGQLFDTLLISVGDGYHVCEECEENMEDVTRYCSISCQLGFGCDGSC